MILFTIELNVKVSSIAYVYISCQLNVCMQMLIAVLMVLLRDNPFLYVKGFALQHLVDCLSVSGALTICQEDGFAL